MKKIVYVVIATIISAFFGLFILPRTVETMRWIELDVSEEKIWSEISQLEQWNSWQPWGEESQKGEVAWYGGTVSISKLDKENLTVHFQVDHKDGEGLLSIEKMPDGLWLGCSYSFQTNYAPWSRLNDWLDRGELALNIDRSLKKIKKKLESN
jgi:hypothetical protein